MRKMRKNNICPVAFAFFALAFSAFIISLLPAAVQAGDTSAAVLSVVVDKSGHTLSVLKGGELLARYPAAVGKNKGDKKSAGDMRTPEGRFKIVKIQDSSYWTHDFRDGKGEIAGAYGPKFIRLGTPPWKGIGIHGTHDPSSVGRDITEGCVRLKNGDLLDVLKYVKPGVTVIIRP